MTKKDKIKEREASEAAAENREPASEETPEETVEKAIEETSKEIETEPEEPSDEETQACDEEVPEQTLEEALISENEALKTELTELKDELEEKEDHFLRLQAEFDNFRRRTLKEKDDLRKNATADLLSDLLPVLDNFDRALIHAEESPILEGIVMIQKQMLEILERGGLEKIGKEGEPFDPKFHDGIMREEREDVDSGVILEVLQPGYKLNDKLLRAAMVKVSQ